MDSLGPANEARKVPFRLNVLTYPKVLRTLFEQWIDLKRGSGGGSGGGSQGK